MTEELSADEIRASLRDYFADRPGLETVRRLRDTAPGSDDELARTGFEAATWKTMAEALGVAGMGAPEEWSGLGVGLPHLVAAAEECGATLAPEPVRAALHVAWALRGLAVEDAPSALADAVSRFLVGDAVPGVSQGEDLSQLPELRDGTVTGRLAEVSHGAVAELVLTPVSAPDGPGVALVLVDPVTVQHQDLPTVDLAGRLAHVVVDAAPAVRLTSAGDQDALQLHFTVARLLLAAEQVGGAEGCLAGMVEYAKVRSQFGQLIGSYQAIQHHCSTTAVDNASARSLVAAAADAVSEGDHIAARQLSLLARAEAGTCFHDATRTLIQVSGGIGFTWEHDAHLFFRRARATASVAGTPDHHRHAAVQAGCLDLLLQAV